MEDLPSGEKLFAFRTRHDGQNHAVKLSLDEIRELLKLTQGEAE